MGYDRAVSREWDNTRLVNHEWATTSIVSHELGRIRLVNHEFDRIKKEAILTKELVWGTSGMILTGEN
jgi:hypothetical protein